MAKRSSAVSRKSPAESRRREGPRSRKPAPKKRQAQQPVEWLRPEHQRELFALGLIAIAAITIVFFLTGSAGPFGQRWVAFTRQLLGWGALLVPLALGLLGVSIMWQERREDVQLTGATVLGTLMLLAALLALLEFAMGVRTGPDERVGEGGGLAGYTLVQLQFLIGRPATLLLYCFIGLGGVLLTFNITLYELISGFRDSLARFWVTIWAPTPRPAGRGEETGPLPAGRGSPQTAGDPQHPYVPPPGGEEEDDIRPTPIAARPTRASLFQRPEVKAKTDAPAKEAPTPSEKPAAGNGARGAAQPGPNTLLTDLLSKPAGAAPASANARPGPEIAGVTQEPLEGFEVPAMQHAWPLPAIDLLEQSLEGSISDDERRTKARLIEETLASFKVEAQVVGVNTGPAVTQFELQPAVGVKVSKITTLEKDLALALAAHSIRIEAPIPGKAVVGIEIPNSAISIVGLRDILESNEFESSKGKLKVGLGRDVSGTPVVAGLERMPHLLMAGSTGSGKSAGINSIVCALLLRYTPDELKFIMVDPKMVELIVYNHIPHMLSPVVTELERVVPTLKWATREMERRYKIFAKHGFRNIDSYKQAARRRADLEPLPYIVIIVDELADLMMMAPDEVETLICRLAQMARATGIHLVLATQRPSVDVVTGLIKANFPSRIAFAVTSQIDSRVILDMNGAEQLLGRGDMLYMAADAARPVRVQGTWVSDPEVERIVTFWRNARPPDATGPGAGSQGSAETTAPVASLVPGPRPPAPGLKGPGEFLSVEEQDELLPEAIKLVKQHQRASASLLQRRLRIGYSKAAQLIDLLEQQGIVGPQEDGRSREVLKGQD